MFTINIDVYRFRIEIFNWIHLMRITFKFALHDFLSNCDSEVEKVSIEEFANILQIFFQNIFLN